MVCDRDDLTARLRSPHRIRCRTPGDDVERFREGIELVRP
jgi:hypothetical protein